MDKVEVAEGRQEGRAPLSLPCHGPWGGEMSYLVLLPQLADFYYVFFQALCGRLMVSAPNVTLSAKLISQREKILLMVAFLPL